MRMSKNDPKWIVKELALSDTQGEVQFNIMTDSQFSSLSKPSTREVDFLSNENRVMQVITTKTDCLSNVYSQLKDQLGFERPYLKMDTQGNDFLVAQGAGDTLREFVGLQSELSILKLYEKTIDYQALIEFYRSKGFELTALIPNNSGFFPRLVEMDCIMHNKGVFESLERQVAHHGPPIGGTASMRDANRPTRPESNAISRRRLDAR